MAIVTIPLQDQLSHAIDEVVFTAGEADGMNFFNNGFCKLIVKTGAGGTGTLTVKSVTDSNRRTGDVVLTLGANKVYESSFFPVSLFNSGGKVDITITDPTDLQVAVIRQSI